MTRSLATSKYVTADKLVREGIKHHEEFVRLFKLAKERGLNSGSCFHMAKEGMEHGEWEAFVAQYSDRISPRTIRFYMEFATEALAWARAVNPKLVGDDQALAVAREMVMQSPKGLVNLCRDLKLMRKFGEYDEVKYRLKKLKSEGQMEFEFDTILTSLEPLTHIGQKNYNFVFRDGVDKKVLIAEAKSKLQTALQRLTEMEATIDV
jgi:hypothetical protein